MDCSKELPLPEFPYEGLIPNEDTQAASFMKKFPHFDGRGTVIAVLDTGIDPSSACMQVTTTGADKIIDIVDCTTSGDVYMSDEIDIQTSTELNEKSVRFVIGADGKKLILNSEWCIPSGKVRVGTKRLYDLTPSGLTDRIISEKKERFMVNHEQLVRDIRSKIDTATLGKPLDSLEEAQQKIINDLNYQLEALTTLKADYVDYGPLVDCVVFHDGANYRAIVNNSTSNNLSDLLPLADYKVERKYALLDSANMFNYSVKIYDQGKLLSIVTVSGSHGTHVAGIAAGYNIKNPEMNGVAPGAQLISLKIADRRVGSLEVGAGLTRAINSIIEHKADLANMSYGEATTIANAGFWVDELQKSVIRKHHCVFVSSAGNNGPGLTSLSAPGGTTEDIISVGIYVGHQQMKANYFMLKKVKETSISWSSLGPTYDGAKSASIYGPGSAVAPYPSYTLKKYEMIEGSSMSSPNVCGCLSLIISGMKHSNYKVTPYRIKRSIVTTAKNVGDILDTGFIQVEKAWNYLVEHRYSNDLDITYKISVDSRNSDRGLYYREFNEATRLNVEDISVTPKFLDNPSTDLSTETGEKYRGIIKREQYDFDKKLVMIATESWIRVPDCLYVNSIGRSFRVSVDCKSLDAGKLHVGSIHAYDAQNSEMGPVFTIPVTVAKPIEIDHTAQLVYNNIFFKPTELKRWYINVPHSASKMVITVQSKNLSASASATFVINCCQLLPQERFDVYKYQNYFNLSQGSYISGTDGVQSAKHFVDVIGGVTLEIVLGQYWSEFDNHEIDLKIEFTGLQIQSAIGLINSVFLNSNHPSTKISLRSDLRRTDSITPNIKLDTLRRAHYPQKAEIKPLISSRDILPGNVSIYALHLTYKLSLTPGKVTMSFPACDNFIYDSWFEDKMIQIFDCNKKLLAIFSVYPSAVDIAQKGDYTAIVMVRHSKPDELEKLKKLTLFADMGISNVSPVISNSFSNTIASASPPKVSNLSIDKGKSYNIYVGGLAYSSIAHVPNNGDLMLGTMDFNNNELFSARVHALVPIKPITESVSSESSSKKTSADINSTKRLSDIEELNKALTDLKMSRLFKISDIGARDKIISELLKTESSNLDLYSTLMDVYDYDKNKAFFFMSTEAKAVKLADVCSFSQKLLEAANKAIELIDIKDLALKIKAKPDSKQTKAVLDEYNELKQQKVKLLKALIKKCRAMIYIHFLSQLYSQKTNFGLYKEEYTTELAGLNISKLPAVKIEDISKSIEDYNSWSQNESDSNEKNKEMDIDFANIKIAYNFLAQNLGYALVELNKSIKNTVLIRSNSESYKKQWENRIEIINKLGWLFWAKNLQDNVYYVFPKELAKF
ncbi:hypothetical protein BB561_003300 [Smittium simulii]|uniref:Uncharacterized protein n=1 Tax=Smittium simulii TaxID=133385 RepID=A0A2T9YM04_9FUNG|nr:hypothetical protein BB561_003300 [Smittium simulii]